MIRKQAASAILAAVALQASFAHGLGLGDIALRSALAQPLDARIRLRGVGDLSPAQIFVRLGSDKDFDQAGVDRVQFLSELRFEVSIDGNGDGVVHVTSNRPVREPYLDFIVEARWPTGRVLREYTVLLDLPIYTGSAAASVTPPARDDGRIEHGDDGGLASGQGEYRVRSGDTLWRIATRSRPAGVTVQQMVNAIHRDNPRAFIGGDVNRMLAGAVLRLPQGSDVGGLAPAMQPAAPVARQVEAAPAQSAAPTEPVATDAPATEPAGEGYLEIAGDTVAPATEQSSGGESGAPGPSSDAAAGGELSAAHEGLLAAARTNEELQDRVKALEAQVADFQKLAELEKEKEKEKEKVAPPAPAESPGLFERLFSSTAALLLVAVAVLAATVAFLFRRRRKVHEFVPVAFDEPRKVDDRPASTAPAAVVPAAATPPVAPAAAAAALTATPAFAEAAEAPDPMDEADVYLAYGRQDRAEEILRDALRGHADLPDVRLKLMEILASRGDESEFLRHFGALDGNAVAQHAAHSILDQHGLQDWVAAVEPAMEPTLASVAVEPVLNREQPLKIDLAAELQQVADTLGGAAAERGTNERSSLLQKTEQVIARAAAELDAAPATLDTAVSGEHDFGEFDLSLDFDEATHEGDTASGELPEFDLPLGDLELDTVDSAPAAAVTTQLDEDLGLLAGSDEVTTKLDLARAYMDMGDMEGARDILDEVESEGTASQREEAAALLARIRSNS